ncbi:MAG: heme exporter protein CcmD [Hydrogenophilaceae bacterium]|nr:heme exporter protein CcmD [Hydrogenophilaceae bacterium]
MMEWASWDAFWAMGGYGLYVWGSFAVTALVIAIEVVLLRQSSRQTVQRLKRLNKWENLDEAKPNPGFGEG